MNNIYFPTTIVDGFLDNPDEVRDYGLQQFANGNIINDTDTRNYPGVRSIPLHKLNPILFDAISDKIMKIFFRHDVPISWSCSMYYQLVESKHGAGWVHRDPTIATCIIYLTPTKQKNIGTSIYKQKYMAAEAILYQSSLDIFKKNNKLSSKEEEKKRLSNNANFDEVIRVEGLYNRLLMFDGSMMHAAQNFVGEGVNDSRLTIVGFIHSLDTKEQQYPITRSKIFQKYIV